MSNKVTKKFLRQLLLLLNAKNCKCPKKLQLFLCFEKDSSLFHTSHMRIFEEIREFCDTVLLERIAIACTGTLTGSVPRAVASWGHAPDPLATARGTDPY